VALSAGPKGSCSFTNGARLTAASRRSEEPVDHHVTTEGRLLMAGRFGWVLEDSLSELE
jgi:hypothetical protein